MNKFTILLVDDIEENLYSLKLLIEDRFDNIQIFSALSAQEAVLKIMKYEIDLILSDVQMPNIDGFQLIEYLKTIEQTKNIPVILITGIAQDEAYIKKGYKSGAVEYITKPLDSELLCSRLGVFLNIYAEKKSDKKQLQLDNKKIASMVKKLDDFSPSIKKSLYSLHKNNNTEQTHANEIDIINILKNI